MVSFPTQVAAAYDHFFAYCLGDRTSRARSSSYLVFGRTPELPSTVFTPLLSNPRRPSLYYVNMVGFSVGGKRITVFSNASLALDPATGRGGFVVDSGTAIPRFARDAYAALRNAFDARAAAAWMRKLASDLPVFDACYELRGSATANVPRIVLHFAGGARMALPPENCLVPVDGGKRRTYYCLGLEAADDGLNVLGTRMALPPENYLVPVDGGKRRTYHCLGLEAADDGLNVLDNVQQQGFRVVFDVEKERVVFAPNGCSV